MKFSFEQSENGWAEIEASPYAFDAYPPIDTLRISWPLAGMSPDRLVVGCTLVFAPWSAGVSVFPEQFSALTSQRVVEWFQLSSISVLPTPVRAGGLPLPRGVRRAAVAHSGVPGADLTVAFRESHLGSTWSAGRVDLASNIGALAGSVDCDVLRLQMRLGAAVLVAESLGVNEIVDPELREADPAAFDSAARLLECVALGLRDE